MPNLDKTAAEKLLKRQYGVGALNVYDISTPFLSQIVKTFNLGGERFERYVPLSSGLGVGTTRDGTVPTANPWKMDRLYLEPIENLASVKLSRTLKYATQSKEHAYVSAQGDYVKRGVEGFRNNTERQLIGTGDGKLGAIESGSTVTVNGGGSYTFDLDPATFIEANFEEGYLVNIGSGNTDLFSIEELDPDELNDGAAPTMTVQLKSGSYVPLAGDEIFMQGSEGNDIFGLRGICKATTGSLYGVPVGRRWKSWYKSVSTTITPAMLDEVILGVHRRCGQAPNLILTSYQQWRILKSTLEGMKRYNTEMITPRFNMKDLQQKFIEKAATGRLGFKAMVYDGPFGSAPILISRYVRKDEMFFLNTSKDGMELMHQKGGGWHDDDGTVFLREAGKTNYEARYGFDMQSFISPPHHGCLDGLLTV